AAENRRLEIIFQETLLGRRSTSELKSALRSVPLDNVHDFVLLHETRRISRLAFALPERMRSLIFEKGIAALGLNLGARLGLTSAVAAAVLLAIAFLVPVGNKPTPSSPALFIVPEKSIAVLPFENLSEDKANAYVADGIQDEILTPLSKIADLKVISRTSTQHYNSAPENLPEIAKQLGVAHI